MQFLQDNVSQDETENEMDNLKKEDEKEEKKDVWVGTNDIIFHMWNRSRVM